MVESEPLPLEPLPCRAVCPHRTRTNIRPCAWGLSSDAEVCCETLIEIISRIEDSGISTISAQIIFSVEGETYLVASKEWQVDLVNWDWNRAVFIQDGGILFFT